MSYLVVLVIDDPADCTCILDAWEEIGVTGVTILKSSGLGRVRKASLRDDFPLMPSLQDILATREVPHRTLFSVVEDQDAVDRMVTAAKDQIGSLDAPHTGFLFVLPVLEAHGLGREPDNAESG